MYIKIIVIVFILQSCMVGVTHDGVNQSVRKNLSGLVESGTALCTYVWYDGEIVKLWADDVETITDSIVLLRQRQGDSLLNTLKKIK